MDTNDIITGKIPQTGSGIQKKYEESIIVLSQTLDFGYAYKKQLFYRDADGVVCWARSEEKYEEHLNNPGLKKVELLSVLPISSDRAFIEIIDSEILRMHLIEEAQYAHALLETEQLKLTK